MALVRPPVSYPGVYIQEVASDVHTITPVDTATTAFIGRTLRGPVNEPVVCNSFADFQATFGGIWAGSKLGYAVDDFFLNGGAKAVIVRLFHPDEQAAITAAAAAATAEAAKHTAPPEAQAAATAVAGKATGSTSVAGMLAAMQAEADKTTTPQEAKDAVAAVIAAAQQAAQSNATPSTATLSLPVASGSAIVLKAKDDGTWGNNLVARIDPLDKIADPLAASKYSLADGKSFFNLTIRDTKTGAEEYFPNLTVSADPSVAARRIDKVLEHQSDLVTVDPASFAGTTALARPTDTGALVPTASHWWDLANKPIVVASTGHGSDGAALTNADVLGDQAQKTGLYALEHADIFNMLCIPPYADGADDVDFSVLSQARAYCERRRAFLIVDPPSTWTHKKDAVDNFPLTELPASSHSAIFFPRIKKADPLRENQIDTFVPCGAIAGIMARTDFRRGVWKAAAGLEATIAGIAGLSVPLTDAENGELNPLGINCLRILPAVGPVVWGARTMEGDDRLGSQWKYIPVRRMALWIEETLYRSTQWAVFEPNDEPLWSSLRLNIGVFMNDLFRQGAFQGQSAKDAYFVKCDSATTTQADIDRGIVNVVVGFAPLKPAEFVILYIQQITGNLAV